MVKSWYRKQAKRLRKPVRWLSGHKQGWGWWFSTDEENYQGPYNSRDEAIHYAIHECAGEGFNGCDGCSRFYLLEAKQGPINLSEWVDANDLLEGMYQHVDDDLGGEDGMDWDFWNAQQEKQLDRWLGLLVAFWQWWNCIEVRTWGFTHSRNAERYTHVEGS